MLNYIDICDRINIIAKRCVNNLITILISLKMKIILKKLLTKFDSDVKIKKSSEDGRQNGL